jgi:predicted O-methyltransferase YrrM
MLSEKERAEIARLWTRKLQQDEQKFPQSQRHRNLEPVSAEFISSLAAGLGAKRLLEIGGSSGISTIALAAAARETGGRLTSIEIEPERQAESRETLHRLDLHHYVEFILGDAAAVLPTLPGPLDFALIDCEKDDYIRFFDMIPAGPGTVVVADNILSHNLDAYVAHLRTRSGVNSVTLPVGKGLEVTVYAGYEPAM